MAAARGGVGAPDSGLAADALREPGAGRADALNAVPCGAMASTSIATTLQPSCLPTLSPHACMRTVQCRAVWSSSHCSMLRLIGAVVSELGLQDGKSRKLLRVVAAISAACKARGWPGYVVEHILLVLIARGGSKMFELHEELVLYCASVRGLLQELRSSLSELDAASATTTAAQGMLSKQRRMTAGCVLATQDLLHWSDRIAAVPDKRLFSASDTNRSFANTMFLPPEFKVSAMLDGFKKAAAKHLPEMRRVIDTCERLRQHCGLFSFFFSRISHGFLSALHTRSLCADALLGAGLIGACNPMVYPNHPL